MKQLDDVQAAARLLSISSSTVRSYIKQGKVRPVRIGRRVLFEEDELERLANDGRDENEQETILGNNKGEEN